MLCFSCNHACIISRLAPRSTSPCYGYYSMHAILCRGSCRPRHGNKRGWFPTHRIRIPCQSHYIVVALLSDPGDRQRVSCDTTCIQGASNIIQPLQAPPFFSKAATRSLHLSLLLAASLQIGKSASGRDVLAASLQTSCTETMRTGLL